MSVDLPQMSLVRAAIKAVPAVKYALGVGGIIAVIAILTAAYKIDIKIAGFGAIVMFVLMMILLLFAKAVGHTGADFRPLVMSFAWFCLMLFMATAIALFTSVFWAQPLNLKQFVVGMQPHQPGPTGPISPAVVQPTGDGGTKIPEPPKGQTTKPPTNGQANEALAETWERRGDQSIKAAIVEEIELTNNGFNPVWTGTKAIDAPLVQLQNDMTEARSAWKTALKYTRKPERIQRLKQKIKGEDGLSCYDLDTDKILCTTNGTHFDSLHFADHSESGKHHTLLP